MTSTETKDRHRQIYAEYLTGKYTIKQLADRFQVSPGVIDRAIANNLRSKKWRRQA